MKRSLFSLFFVSIFLFFSCTAGFNSSSSPSSAPQSEDDYNNDDGSTLSSFERRGHASFDQALDFYDAATDFCVEKDYDAALEALDQAYDLILRAESRTPTDFQQRDDLRLTIAKRILEVHSSRKMGISGPQSPIQVPLNNPYVDAEIKRFTGPEREFFRQAYRRSGLYNEYTLKKLRERGLPEELVWLPLIESGYQVQALSSARALGLWQFIPSTGVRFGLKRELLVDERMDPEKSTDAALAYLAELHDLFGDWPTVLAAYNCGEGRVRATIRNQNVNYLDNFWDLYTRLPRETARYVPRFLATIHIINNMEKYGFDPQDLASPKSYEKITVERQAALKDIAQATGIPLEDLKALNPALRYAILPKEPYPLKVPPGYTDTVLASIESISESNPPQQTVRLRHRIKPGESLTTIANHYKVPVKRIMKENGIRRANLIQAGKIIVISDATPPAGPVQAQTRDTRNKPAFTYTVKQGDTLSSLAKRFDTEMKAIMAENKLSGTSLRVNQQLRIPGTGQKIKSTASKREGSSYVVQAGDSPIIIAEKHNIPLKHFLKINNLNTKSTIHPGQRVYVKWQTPL